ncbi:MAG: metallophosphoesterase [Desulfobacteraceae bacterium]|nr:metallophosphoesterase [Desulfobacteraceae bacterium]
MIRFLLVFFSVYTLMHALFYVRVRVLLHGRFHLHLIVVLFLLLMISAPAGARLLERADYYDCARVLATIGYSWLGFIFYAFLGYLLLGAFGALTGLINLAAGSTLPTLTGERSTAAVLFCVLAILGYGYLEARSIRLELMEISTSKLPEGVDRIRIAQISDVHLGLLVREGRMGMILDRVESAAPDILVCTGDLVDGNMSRIESLPALFGKIRPRLGKYAVTGNHEVYSGYSGAMSALKEMGFTVLSGEALTVGNLINIVGVDDPSLGLPQNERAILGRAANGLFTVFLKHRPDPSQESRGLFDLQLSGHTHYGQLFPFRLFSRLIYPLQNGPYRLAGDAILYTSRGSGTWGPPFRVLAPPEVTIFDIVRE